jgi:hypothetical protein
MLVRKEGTSCGRDLRVDGRDKEVNSETSGIHSVISGNLFGTSVPLSTINGGDGYRAKGVGVGESYRPRGPAIPYVAYFGDKKCDIGAENTYFWDFVPHESIG